jgi:MoaA/NifB/PqqE/SkfB family radical SAM enzyme
MHRKEGNILEFKNEELILQGLRDGRRAFCGPEIVQFDITNRCNNNCLCCWNNSPLLGELTSEEKIERQQELPLDLVKKTIQELSQLRTRTLFFAGGGEPFMHPDFMEILRCAKYYNMRVFINTNFILLDEEKLFDSVDLKIDLIHVSILAGTPQTYVLIHPNKKEEDFYRIRDSLLYLATLKDIKRVCDPSGPHIDMYYVIFNKNYHEIDAMVELAIKVRANSMEFVPIDIIPGKTDVLLLNRKQIKIVRNSIKGQIKKLERLEDEHLFHIPFIQNVNLFFKRLSSKNADKGEYEEITVSKMPCYVGWAFARILADGTVTPCLKAHHISIGNIYHRSFKEIWNSPKQEEFRAKTLSLNPDDPYFKKIGNTADKKFGCLKSCDNIKINIEMHKRFQRKVRRDGNQKF